jgi:hypothetical protein
MHEEHDKTGKKSQEIEVGCQIHEQLTLYTSFSLLKH